MITPRYLAGFTGHRQLDNPDGVRSALAAELAALKAQIEKAGGILEFYSSAAYGADTIACEEAAKLGIPVHIILPKPVVLVPETGDLDHKEGFAADFWKGDTFLASEWERTYRLIQAAVSGAKGGTFRLATGTQTHPECYYDTGLQMLEAIDVLITVWDGQPALGLGGTQHFVSLAEKAEMPRIIISPHGGPAEQIGLDLLSKAQEKGLIIFEELETFSKDCAVCQGGQPETSEQYFSRLETCSNRHSKDFRLSLVLTILWHGSATLVAAVAAVLPQTDLPWKIVLACLAALELLLVVKAFLRVRRLHHDQTHERWMQSRFAAELMRAMRHSAGLLDPLHPLIARHHPHWRRFATTAGLMIFRESPRQSWATARKHYLDNRLRHPDTRIGQIKYFTTKQVEAEPHFKRTHWWGSKLGGAAIVFVILALVFKVYVISAKHLLKDILHWPYPVSLSEKGAGLISWIAAFCFIFLPIALPLAAGVFISLRAALDSGRRTYRYKELSQRLTAAAATLETLQTEAAVRRTIAATEEVLLDELVEWHLAEQQNGAH
jgi:hypothetical protein